MPKFKIPKGWHGEGVFTDRVDKLIKAYLVAAFAKLANQGVAIVGSKTLAGMAKDMLYIGIWHGRHMSDKEWKHFQEMADNKEAMELLVGSTTFLSSGDVEKSAEHVEALVNGKG